MKHYKKHWELTEPEDDRAWGQWGGIGVISAWFKNGDKRVTCWSPQNSVGMPKHEGLDSNLNTLSVTLN
jgi:hypothetical protein